MDLFDYNTDLFGSDTEHFIYTMCPIPETIQNILSFDYEIRPSINQYFYYIEYITDTSKKNIFINWFHKCQRIYFIFTRFAKHIKHRYSRLCVTTDMFLEPINENSPYVFRLIEKETRNAYLFTNKDIIRIIITAITHHNHFHHLPLPPKNPYTNIQFTKTELVNMYLFIRSNIVSIPILLQHYFATEFDLCLFSFSHSEEIREYNITQYFRTMTVAEQIIHFLEIFTLHNESIYMKIKKLQSIAIVTDDIFFTESIHEKISVLHGKLFLFDNRFPISKIIADLQGVLYIYLHYAYSINIMKKPYLFANILKFLDNFTNNHPRYGRRKYVRIPTTQTTVIPNRHFKLSFFT